MAPAATEAPSASEAPGPSELGTLPPAGGVASTSTLLTPTPTPPATQTLHERAETDSGSIPSTATLQVQRPVEQGVVEPRLVELEYPETLRLGDSDIIRLTLLPSPDGYVIQSEFPDHTTLTQTVQVQHPDGYDLIAIARLDAVNFTFSPAGEQEQNLLPGETIVWFWSLAPNAAGQQRLTVTLALRWQPRPGVVGNTRQVTAYSRSLEVRVVSFLGLTRHQAALGGLASLAAGGGLGLIVFAGGRSRARKVLQAVSPNPTLVLEPRPGLSLLPHERQLLAALFQKYARLTIESEFLSGYSGARTFLAIPIHPDGRADAATIVKLGEAASIEREYHNYEDFVKDSLPPVTARIQRPPVTLPALVGRVASSGAHPRAALQYTFIGAPGQSPQSLRLALLESPNSALLYKLFETFGPNWWMQRRPYTFRLALEYDRLLPSHFVVEPASGRGKVLDGAAGLAATGFLQEGDVVSLRGFRHVERRADGRFSLRGDVSPGMPPLRVRWLGDGNPNGATGCVVATRQTLLSRFTAGMDLFGLPDPLERLPLWLDETVHGSQSTIHGDLNLENVLTGPGGFVWLIDFAQTREGHPLADFAHLEAEIIAHIIAPNILDPAEYFAFLDQSDRSSSDNTLASERACYALRNVVAEIAAHCLFNPSKPREYELARLMACLGALKYGNLDQHAKHLLYLTAAHLASRL
ncbi:MAG: phosphotransferase [Chloroflexota bacterium]